MRYTNDIEGESPTPPPRPMTYAAAFTQPYTQTEILHFADGTSGIHATKSVRRFAFDAVTGPCSAYHLAGWQDINPSITGVTFQYDPA